jgi:hypothetical protein
LDQPHGAATEHHPAKLPGSSPRRLAIVVAAALLLAGCHGWGTPDTAVYPDGDAAHTPPPAVNLPPNDIPRGAPSFHG